MRIVHASTIAAVLMLTTSLSAANPRVRRGPTAPRVSKYKPTAKARLSSTSIDSERATQIQNALIKAGYLTGVPSGTWDSTTQAAMEKLQSDNGWQTKLVPDSRAIIKLGLGSNNTQANVLSATSGDELETPAAAEPAQTPVVGAR